jgi:hypothetical protein
VHDLLALQAAVESTRQAMMALPEHPLAHPSGVKEAWQGAREAQWRALAAVREALCAGLGLAPVYGVSAESPIPLSSPSRQLSLYVTEIGIEASRFLYADELAELERLVPGVPVRATSGSPGRWPSQAAGAAPSWGAAR